MGSGLKLDVKGTLGKFGYHNLPDNITDEIIYIVTEHAYMTAVKRAPYDPTPDGIHIKENIKRYYSKIGRFGEVWIDLPYALVAEYGSKKRLAHPYMRPAGVAARNKMKAIIKVAAKQSIAEEKAKAV